MGISEGVQSTHDRGETDDWLLWYPNCSVNRNLSQFCSFGFQICIYAFLHPEDKKRGFVIFFWESSGLKFQCMCCWYWMWFIPACFCLLISFLYKRTLSPPPPPHQLCAECKIGGRLLHYAVSFQSRNCMSEIILKMHLEERDLCLQAEILKIIFWKRSLFI